MTDAPPQRIRLSRAKGFNLQVFSQALNGLPAAKVDRSTKWGNPFIAGKPNPLLPGRLVADRRHAFVLYRSMAPQNPELVALARAELRGHNLACWCDHLDPYEDVCHGAPLMEIANG